MNEVAKMGRSVHVGGQTSVCLIAMSGIVLPISLVRIKSKEGERGIL